MMHGELKEKNGSGRRMIAGSHPRGRYENFGIEQLGIICQVLNSNISERRSRPTDRKDTAAAIA